MLNERFPKKLNAKKAFVLLLLALNPLYFYADSGESGEELEAASGGALSAGLELSAAGLVLSGTVVWTIGEPLSEMVIEIANATGIVIAKTATVTLNVATESMNYSTDVLNESTEMLGGTPATVNGQDIVSKVVLMTASDALKLAEVVEGNRILSEIEKRYFADLGLDPLQLAGSVLKREGLEGFRQDPAQMIFAVKTNKMLYMITVEEMERTAAN